MSLPPSTIRDQGRKIWRAGTLVYTSGGLAVLFFWLLLGDFSWQLKDRGVFPVAQLMLKNMASSDLVIGALIGSFPAAIGMILGPIISVKSDRHRGRWGRRIPFLLVSAPIAALSMMLLGLAPAMARGLHHLLGSSSPGLFPLGILLFAMIWAAFEIASIVTNSVFGGLVNDTVPTEVIGRFFGLFRAVGLLAGIFFNFAIIGHAESYYAVIMAGTGLLYGIGFTAMCLRVKEGEYPPLPPREDSRPHPVREIMVYAKECFGHSFYLWLFIGYSLAMAAPVPVNMFSVIYARDLGMDMSSYGRCLVITYIVSLVLAYFLGALADRFHPLRLAVYSILLYSLAMFWGGFFVHSIEAFKVVFILHGILSGIFFTTTASLGQRLFPKDKFAQFSSAMGLTIGLGAMLLPGLMGLLLDLTGQIYRYTFAAGGVFGIVGALCLAMTYAKFVRLGRPQCPDVSLLKSTP